MVAVLVEGERGRGQGSGVVWREDATIITNAHVVAGAREVRVRLAGGAELPARVVASAPRSDVAVLVRARGQRETVAVRLGELPDPAPERFPAP